MLVHEMFDVTLDGSDCLEMLSGPDGLYNYDNMCSSRWHSSLKV